MPEFGTNPAAKLQGGFRSVISLLWASESSTVNRSPLTLALLTEAEAPQFQA